jgi:hypothetical protein
MPVLKPRKASTLTVGHMNLLIKQLHNCPPNLKINNMPPLNSPCWERHEYQPSFSNTNAKRQSRPQTAPTKRSHSNQERAFVNDDKASNNNTTYIMQERKLVRIQCINLIAKDCIFILELLILFFSLLERRTSLLYVKVRYED